MTSATAASSDVTDGPVLTLINKRIRNLKKKLNRIGQLEESIAQGKSVIKNKEQQDLLASKPSILAAVDELEKFRQPLSFAVDEEINLALNTTLAKQESNENVVDGENGSKSKTLGNVENETATFKVEVVDDLLSLLYFGSMFDVKSQNDFNSIMLTRTHERNCCLTYDYVTDDDAAVMLGETDLDLISSMSSLLISRPADSSLSHQNALRRCIEHAKLWIEKAELPISSNSNVTYAALREKLAKIMGSDYLKITPEMKATADVAAEAAGNYAFHALMENTVAQHEQKEDDVSVFQINEKSGDQSIPIEDHRKQQEADAENSKEFLAQTEPTETNAGGAEYKEQYVPRRSYQNQKGGGRNGSSGGGRRGYGNGRGGRSGGRGGPYQNGRNQYNEQPGNYYPRNHHSGRGGRGDRGNNGVSYAASGVEAAAES
ncbi:uncharacterized protein [Rutidosis leptorrhynchoides]|uniref:uncharacterized protein n=1 Tax=Rutidosis leptorrhynchoides TaxID=125765 RepID=UPI003A98FA67